MEKHTLGPWAIHADQEYVGFRIDGPSGRAIAHAIERDSHPSIGEGISKGQALANATLIAEAPSLLAEMHSAMRSMVEIAFEAGFGRLPNGREMEVTIKAAKPDSPIGRMRDAIARAEGAS